MKYNTRIWIAAAALGLITVIALNMYLKSLRQAAVIEQEKTAVVIAARTIPAHTRITAEMLEVTELPAESIHPAAFRSLNDATGGITRAEIIEGEQVLADRVIADKLRGTLSYRIPDNMRAISIPVNEVTGVAGYIAAGDRVDVLVTYQDERIHEETITYTVLQNVAVLAAGDNPGDMDTAEPQHVSTVTLAVTPAQAEVLAFAFISGSFHLTLRSPVDTGTVELDSYSPDNFETFRER
ncbi:MAG TPA: Flp pilus assembly protein CpaB [Bacillota bacterium]|nr:Flp pilus assembly protein CpaB [Bacillota bacterium]